MCKDVYCLTLKYLMGHDIGECKHTIFFLIESPILILGGGGELWRTKKKLVNYGHYLSF